MCLGLCVCMGADVVGFRSVCDGESTSVTSVMCDCERLNESMLDYELCEYERVRVKTHQGYWP